MTGGAGRGSAATQPSAAEGASAATPATSGSSASGAALGASASVPASSGGSASAPTAEGTRPAAAEPTSPPSVTDPAAPATPAGTTRPRILVKRFGALTGEEIPLMGERVLVGRFDPETGPVDIDLSATGESAHVSRHHGELYREADGRWFLRDLGSTNGVFAKGASDASFGPRITAPRPLADGDELAFGNARFVFKAS